MVLTFEFTQVTKVPPASGNEGSYKDWRDSVKKLGKIPDFTVSEEHSDRTFNLSLHHSMDTPVPRKIKGEKWPAAYIQCLAHATGEVERCMMKWQVFRCSGSFIRLNFDASFDETVGFVFFQRLGSFLGW